MWTPAKLGGIGKLGDAALAATCIPAPYTEGNYSNPDRVTCSGMIFSEKAFALSWPGEGLADTVPIVRSASPTTGASYVSRPPTPAPTTQAAAATGAPIGPVTLVAPLPSITPAHPDTATDDKQGGWQCQVNGWAADNPLLAVGLAAAVFFVVRSAGRR